ncbi:MAG: hypothetical protein JW923_03580 [Spirochaetales bacterium]|nr:hypothetical protein [Spirochaetales bacterium]
MHKEADFVERCRQRGLDQTAIDHELGFLARLETWFSAAGFSMDKPDTSAAEAFLADQVASGANGEQAVRALARYFTATGELALAIRFLAYLLPIGVLPDMSSRLGTLAGAAARNRVMEAFSVPAPGSPPEAYPEKTAAFVRALESELGPERARQVLTWNVHGIPAAAFADERERYLSLGSVDAWLADYHARQVAVLQKHADEGTLWFEQRITQDVVAFVRSNQEILAGVRHGNSVFETKIPYDPDAYLKATDRLTRRRLACHCPLAVSGITEAGSTVPAAWCACSAGYQKFRFDVVLAADTEARVVESVLDGADTCRFEIRLPAAC